MQLIKGSAAFFVVALVLFTATPSQAAVAPLSLQKSIDAARRDFQTRIGGSREIYTLVFIDASPLLAAHSHRLASDCALDPASVTLFFENNPVQNTDPTGLQSIGSIIAGTVIVGGIIGGVIADDFYFGIHEIKPGTEYSTKIEAARQEIQNAGLFDGNISWAYDHVKPFYFQRRRNIAATSRGSLALTEPIGSNRATIRTTIYEHTFRKFGAPKKLAIILYHELIHGLPSDYYELNAWRGSAKIAKRLGYPSPIDKKWVKSNALKEHATIIDSDFD